MDAPLNPRLSDPKLNSVSSVNRATLEPSGKQFEVLPDQSLLEAGLSAGVALPFGCSNGNCGDCVALIKSGQTRKIQHHDFTLTQAQKLEGYCLLCSHTADTDVAIEVREATSSRDIPEQQLQAKLCRVEHQAGVDLVSFKFARGKALRFLPGQSVTLTLDNGDKAQLPISSCPCNAQLVELHLNNKTTDEKLKAFTAQVLELKSRARVSINGPTGTFTLSTNHLKPKLFIAIGDEFAQLQGMIEQVLNGETCPPCYLAWQETELTPLYRSNLCRSWHDAIDEFSFTPIGSQNGLIETLVSSDAGIAEKNVEHHWSETLSQCEVYLAKPNPTLIEKLIQLGVQADSILFPSENE